MNAAQAAAVMSNGMSGPFNQVNAQQAYFADTSQVTAPVDAGATAPATPAEAAPTSNGIIGKPATWWIGLAIITAIFIWISRRAGGPEKFGNIKLTIWNGIFSAAWLILILNFLKVVFTYINVPGWSDLVKAA